MQKNRVLGVPISLWIAFFAFADLALAFPRLDLMASGFFFDPPLGFVINGLWWERILYRSVNLILPAVMLAVILRWWMGRRRAQRSDRTQPTGHPTGRQIWLLLALLALVPGLLVNQGFKEHLGRARPVDLVEFGADKTFTPAFIPSDQDGGSFCSGHAAAAIFLVVVAAELAGVGSPWFYLALLYAIAVSLLRVSSGGHFPSDVLASGFFVWIGYLMLSAVFPPARQDD